MRVIVIHPYTRFEVCGPSHFEDLADSVTALIVVVTLTFDL